MTNLPHTLMLAFRPFVTPLPIWDYWYVLLLPLVAAVAIVYKSIKCRSMSTVPKEAAILFAWIIVGLVFAGAALAGVVKVME